MAFLCLAKKARKERVSVMRCRSGFVISVLVFQLIALFYSFIFKAPTHCAHIPSASWARIAENRTKIDLPIGISEVDIAHPSTHQEPVDVLVTVYTYGRPRHLLRLLQDIAREGDKSNLRIGVNVIDDNSMGCVSEPSGISIFSSNRHPKNSVFHLTEMYENSASFLNQAPCSARTRFRHVERFVRQRSWNMYVSKYRHGRRRYWHLVRTAHSLLRKREAKYYVFLQDDNRLASDFFEKAIDAWNSITDTRKTTLMLHIEATREHVPVWTNVKPQQYNNGIFRIGWVDSGNFLCTRKLLELVRWSFPAVLVNRWVRNPTLSSGVGSTLSELIHSSGLRMYRTEESLVANLGVALSKMNFEFRKKNKRALVTRHFADGDSVYEKYLEEAATVSASMASTWLRESALHAAVNSLSHQVDHLNVYLNGYDVVPVFLQQPHISVIQSQSRGGKGDIGDIGKFFWCNDLKTEYHITVDDDIIYPEDYVRTLVSVRQSFKGPVIVGVHGIRVIEELLVPSDPAIRGKGYYSSRRVWMGVGKVERPVNVHILGTGTVLYKVSDLGAVDVFHVFREPNMADIWLGGLAQKLKIPMMVIPHRAGWLRSIPGTSEESIFKRYGNNKKRSSDRLQTAAAKSYVPWVLHKPKISVLSPRKKDAGELLA